MSDTSVLVARPVPGVALITLNRPEHGNGVVPEMAEALLRTLTALEEDDSARAVVLTGAGRQFCAGADLHALRDYLDTRFEKEQEPFNARVLFPVTERITTSRLPFIAAINGGATAGGLDLALACDLRIASRSAKLGETYVKVGLSPGNGGTYFLPRLLGSAKAAELALTGDVIGAEEALRIGLVTAVHEPDELLNAALVLASKIAANPWRAVEATKRALRASWHMDLPTTLQTSYWTVAALHHTHDFREAVDAFIEKRPPRFEGIDESGGSE